MWFWDRIGVLMVDTCIPESWAFLVRVLQGATATPPRIINTKRTMTGRSWSPLGSVSAIFCFLCWKHCQAVVVEVSKTCRGGCSALMYSYQEVETSWDILSKFVEYSAESLQIVGLKSMGPVRFYYFGHFPLNWKFFIL